MEDLLQLLRDLGGFLGLWQELGCLFQDARLDGEEEIVFFMQPTYLPCVLPFFVAKYLKILEMSALTSGDYLRFPALPAKLCDVLNDNLEL